MNLRAILALLLFYSAILCSQVYAAMDITSATRISLAAAQNLLAAPSLPTLDAGGKFTVAPSIGLMSATTEGSSDVTAQPNSIPPMPAYTATYQGKLSGMSGGLSFTSPTYGRTGFFLFLVGSKMTGEINSYYGSQVAYAMKDIKAQAVGAAGGVSYRFIGDSKSQFALGGFLGPAYMNLDSYFHPEVYLPQGAGSDSEFKISVLGSYVGVQAQIRLWKFLINPYFLQMQEISKKCESITSGIFGNWSGDCGGSPISSELNPDTSFTGFGLFLGYGALRLNVYSKANLNSRLAENKLTNYSLSYTFGLSDEQH